MEDGELDIEEGEVAAEGVAQSARPSVPLPPDSPDYDGVLPPRKPKKAKLAKALAAGYFDVYGSQARAEVQLHSSRAIRLLDVQNLLLWVLADGMNPSWCFVKNKALVSKVVMVGMPGLDADLYSSKREALPIMHQKLGSPATVLAKNAHVRTGSTLTTLFTVPFSKKRKRDSNQQQQQWQSCHEGPPNGKQVTFPPDHYCMTLEQMEANNYPLPDIDDEAHMACPAGFIATQPAGDKAVLDMVSLDCEMCSTAEGLELTRASLIDSKGQVLLDELVLPDNPILDYHTQFSGITQQALASITTSLADIQKRICEFLTAETLLVGHGLENDLRALKIIHANCLDTSVLYPHPKGPPCKPALRVLAERYLKRTIQQGEHDSVVDACAALDLVKLKVARGPAFGTYLQGEQGDKLMDVLHSHNKRCTLIDRTDMLNRHVTAGASAVVATDDEEAVSKTCKEVAKAGTDFVWTQLRSLGTFLGTRAAQKQQQQRAQALSQQDQPQDNPSPAAAASPNDAAAVAQPNGTTAARHQADLSHDTQAMLMAVRPESNGAVAGAPDGMQPKDRTDSNFTSDPPANRFRMPSQNGTVKKEEAASTTHEHTESHKYVTTERDASGNQQAAAEVVQKKTTTQVHKRKREEAHVGHGGNEAEPCKAEAGPSAGPSQQPSPLVQDAAVDCGDAGLQNCKHPADDLPATQGALSTSADQELSEEQLNTVLGGLDKCVGSMIEALPVNGLLIVFTCQGDTAEYRRMQEDKMRRQAGLEGLRPWTADDEAKMAPTASRVCRALCFSYVKV